MVFLKHQIILWLLFFFHITALSQEHLTSEEAYQKYQDISSKMAESFPEDDYKTFRRSSFSEQQLQTYLSQHFTRMDLLPYIEEKPIFVLYAYLSSANWFREIGFYAQSNEYYKRFFEYYEAHGVELPPQEKINYLELRSFARGVMADNYAKLSLLDSASIQHQKNIAFTDPLDIIAKPSAINNYGLFYYWTKKDLDSAQIHFKRAYEITLKKYPKHTLLGSIRDNIADVYVDKGNFAEAKDLYATNFDYYKTALIERTDRRDIVRLISAGAQLVQTSLKLKDISYAEQVFKELDSIVDDAKTNKTLVSESKLIFLKTKEALFKAQNNLPMAYETLEHLNFLSDSLATIAAQQDSKWRDELNNITLDRVALNFEIEQIEKENKISSQRAKLWISTLTSSVFIILLLVLFLGRRQHLFNAKNKQLLAEQTLENTALKVEQLNSEIKSKERDLSDFALNLTQNQEWAEMLASKINTLKASEPKDRNVLLEELEQDIKNKVQFDNDSRVFFERLDKLNDAFYSHLTSEFPNLTKNEIRLCSLIRLKMDSHSIATLQNITLASLNTSRYRMRKKMALADDVNLDDFILQL